MVRVLLDVIATSHGDLAMIQPEVPPHAQRRPSADNHGPPPSGTGRERTMVDNPGRQPRGLYTAAKPQSRLSGDYRTLATGCYR